MATAHLPPQPIVRHAAAAMDALAVTALIVVVHTRLPVTHLILVAVLAVAADQGAVRRSHVGRERVLQYGIRRNRFKRLPRYAKMRRS